MLPVENTKWSNPSLLRNYCRGAKIQVSEVTVLSFLPTPVFGKGEHQERQTKETLPYPYRKPTVELLVSMEIPDQRQQLQPRARLQQVGGSQSIKEAVI